MPGFSMDFLKRSNLEILIVLAVAIKCCSIVAILAEFLDSIDIDLSIANRRLRGMTIDRAVFTPAIKFSYQNDNFSSTNLC
jgi:hypothetical protein